MSPVQSSLQLINTPGIVVVEWEMQALNAHDRWSKCYCKLERWAMLADFIMIEQLETMQLGSMTNKDLIVVAKHTLATE